MKSLFKFFSNLVTLGITTTNDDLLNQKIRLANIANIIVGVGSIYFIYALSRVAPLLTIVPITSLLLILASMFVMSIGLVNISRIFTCIVALSTPTLVQAAAMQVGEPPLLSIYMIMFSAMIVPFLVFAGNEWRYLTPILIYSFICYVLIKPISSIIDIPFDNTELRAPIRETINAVVSFLLIALQMAGLIRYNYLFYINNQGMLDNVRKSQGNLEKSERELKSLLKKIEANKDKEEQQVWIINGLNQISNLLNLQENLDKSSNDLIKFIATYTGAAQGALFFDDEQTKTLHLTASYAYGRRKHIKREIEPGEGLLGQAYLEAETVFLTDIPKDHFNIMSGLGEAKPTSLIILPLKLNDRMTGMIELASFEPFEEYKREFLERAADNIASSVVVIRNNNATKRYLEEMEVLNKELQVQEEETRQNLEEMEAIQETMDRKESEYRQIISNLEEQLAMIKNVGEEQN